MDAVAVEATIIAGVAVLAAIVAVLAWRSMQRSGNPGIRFVVAGFTLLTVKNGVKAALLAAGGADAPWELAFSLADLASVALIATPLVRGARRG